jgi:hypothetical protein
MLRIALFFVLFGPLSAVAQTNLAHGFSKLPAGASVVVMPADIELFEISTGGVTEPRADWTELAERHVTQGLRARKAKLGAEVKALEEGNDAAIAALLRLYRAVSEAVVVHHFGALKLPTKEGRLDWTLGPDAAPLRERTGADYALFTWIRDAYASEARKAAMLVGALFGLPLAGGVQLAYASLVDLRSGQVVWFNRLRRMSGDLRESEAAQETLDALLAGFPE